MLENVSKSNSLPFPNFSLQEKASTASKFSGTSRPSNPRRGKNGKSSSGDGIAVQWRISDASSFANDNVKMFVPAATGENGSGTSGKFDPMGFIANSFYEFVDWFFDEDEEDEDEEDKEDSWCQYLM